MRATLVSRFTTHILKVLFLAMMKAISHCGTLRMENWWVGLARLTARIPKAKKERSLVELLMSTLDDSLPLVKMAASRFGISVTVMLWKTWSLSHLRTNQQKPNPQLKLSPQRSQDVSLLRYWLWPKNQKRIRTEKLRRRKKRKKRTKWKKIKTWFLTSSPLDGIANSTSGTTTVRAPMKLW